MDKFLFWKFLIRFIMESYIIGFMCCLINLRNLDFSFEDKWTSINAVITCVIFPFLFFFPIWAIKKMYKNFGFLKQRIVNDRIGELYIGFRTERKIMLIY